MISEASFQPEPVQGLKGVSFSFSVEGLDGTPFNEAAVQYLNEQIGAGQDVELESPHAPEAASRAGMLLHWVYSIQRLQGWPIFQVGAFESAGGSDLDGTYHVPTLKGPRLLSYRLLQLLLTEALLQPSDGFRPQAFAVKLKQFVERFFASAPKDPMQRSVILGLHRRGVGLREIAQYIYHVEGEKKGRFIRGTVTEHASALLHEVSQDRIAMTRLLGLHNIPTVECRRIYNTDQALAAAAAFKYPVLLKPARSIDAAPIVPNIPNAATLKQRMIGYEPHLKSAVLENHVAGDSLSLLIMGKKLVWAVKRTFITVTGDGKTPLRELLLAYAGKTISSPSQHKEAMPLPRFMRYHNVHALLQAQRLTANSVLAAGSELQLSPVPRLSHAAIAEMVDESRLGQQILEHADYLAHLFGHAPMGLDFIAEPMADGTYQDATVLGVHYGPTVSEGPLMERFLDEYLALYAS